VSFAAGDWSLATIEEDAADLAAIGRALAPAGELCLWSCETAAGIAGAAFVAALADAACAEIAAAEHPVGAASLGASWKLTVGAPGASAEAPLTAAARLSYAGVLAVEVTVTGTLPVGNTTANVTYLIVDRARNAIVGQVVLPDAMPQSTGVAIPIRVPSGGGSLEIGTFDANGAFQPCAFLSVSGPGGAPPPGGPVGFGR
jgi:hypothetical protein